METIRCEKCKCVRKIDKIEGWTIKKDKIICLNCRLNLLENYLELKWLK